METRARVIGFHALSDGRFVKINDKKQVEICSGKSRIHIRVEMAPDSVSKTLLIEIKNDKIILVYSSKVVDKTLIALLDLNTEQCISTELHQVDRGYLSLLPDNTFMLGSKDFGAAIFSYRNNRLREISRDYLPNGWGLRRMVMLENKIVLYGTNHPARLVLAPFVLHRDFEKDYEKNVDRLIDQHGSITDVVSLTHDV